MSAWVTKEWVADGNRRREKAKPGVRGIRDSESFVVEWWDPIRKKRCRQKIREKGASGKAEADRIAREVNAKMELGSYAPPVVGTFAEAKDRFIRDVLPTKRSEATQAELKATLERFEKTLPATLLAGISTDTIDQFKGARLRQKTKDKKQIRASTVNKDLRNLRSFFRKMKKWKLITEVPDFEMLPETELEKPVYTEAEFSKMYQQAGAAEMPRELSPALRRLWWETLLVIYWETGCRRTELLKVDWKHVDLDKRFFVITAENTKTRRPKHFAFGELVERHLRALGASGMTGNVFVFRNSETMLNKELKKIQKAAGLTGKKNLAFHAIRRTVGETTAALYGLTAAQHKLGHTNAAVTAKHYAQAAMRGLQAKSAMPTPAGMDGGGLRIVG